MNPASDETSKNEKLFLDFTEVEKTLSRRTAVEEAQMFPQTSDPAGQPLCPLGVDVAAFIRILREGKVEATYEKICEHNPLPGICGRVCPAPCEKSFAARHPERGAVEIRRLERFAADHGRQRWAFGKAPNVGGKRIAVVGSGPSGLTASAILARKGYRVTLYEAMPEVGGRLRYGTANFRLPDKILDTTVSGIEMLGVEIKTNYMIGNTVTYKELRGQGFLAVVIASGAGAPEKLNIPGTHLGGVYYDAELMFLLRSTRIHKISRRRQIKIGRQVVVIGHGPEALDCARYGLRLGSEVSLVFSKIEEELDIRSSDLDEAMKEGVRLEGMVLSEEIIAGQDGFAAGLKCRRLDFADPEKNEQWRLIPVPDSEFVIDAQTVIISTGQGPNETIGRFIPDLRMTKQGGVKIDPRNFSTSLKDVFAAGRAVGGSLSIIDSMVSGKNAAEGVDKFLKGK